MRPPIHITNCNKFGKATNKWYFKIGNRPYRGFGKDDFKQGITWLQSILGGNNGS